MVESNRDEKREEDEEAKDESRSIEDIVQGLAIHDVMAPFANAPNGSVGRRDKGARRKS